MLAQLQAFDDALASYSQQNNNQNQNDDLYSDVNTSEDKTDDFSAGDHIIRFSQTRHDYSSQMHRDSVIKDIHNKVTTLERKVTFLLSFMGIDDFPVVENNKDTVQTQGNDKDSSSITPT